MGHPSLTTIHTQAGTSGLSGTVARIKERLIVQPRPDAFGVAQVAVLPLLQACGVDIFDLDVLRGTANGTTVDYRVRQGDANAVMTVYGVGVPLARGLGWNDGVDGAFSLHTNGSDWQLLVRAEDAYGFGLYDDVFTSVIARLFQAGGPDSDRRLNLARVLLQEQWLADMLARLARDIGNEELRRLIGGPQGEPEQVLALLRERHLLRERRAVDERAVRRAVAVTIRATELGWVREADPLDAITVEDLLLHAESVANLRGKLRATFDGVPLPIASRSGLYFVLAAVAVQYGREDAIPAEDLVTPPAHVPPGLRARPLGRPGWALLMTRNGASLVEATESLLETLGLKHRLQATHRGQPYTPADPDAP